MMPVLRILEGLRFGYAYSASSVFDIAEYRSFFAGLLPSEAETI